MPRILVPLDGSQSSLNALEVAIERARQNGADIHILHVEASIPASVTDFVGTKAVKGFHDEEAEKVLGPAGKRLEAAGVPYEAKWRTGSPAETIVAYAREKKCTEIVMGSRGLGRLTSALLGSVASEVSELASVPVTPVK